MRRLTVVLALAFVGGLPGCESTGTGLRTVEPAFGNVAGNDDVILTGNGFGPGMTIHFGRNQVRSLIIESALRARVKTPSGPEGVVDVALTTTDGRTYVLKRAYRYRSEAQTSK
ncbi:MAG: IPT/TIG domain-containing protein [Deltaproteobacteria bacterium]|nr:IPT/TIG domain-containing protein [Deltaproteobacteria bacterium]